MYQIRPKFPLWIAMLGTFLGLLPMSILTLITWVTPDVTPDAPSSSEQAKAICRSAGGKGVVSFVGDDPIERVICHHKDGLLYVNLRSGSVRLMKKWR